MRALVVGGGIAGLAAAHRFLEKGWDVRVLEAGPRAGGSIGTESVDGFLLERGPDCFLTAKPETLAVCAELGLTPRIVGTIEANRRSLVAWKGRLRAVPEGFYLLAPTSLRALLAADLFSWPGRARMAMDLLLPRRKGPADETLANFVRRRFGQEALERLAQPMIASITTADPETLSVRAAVPQFEEMERVHRSVILALLRRGVPPATSGPRYGLFASFDGGMQVLSDAFLARLAGRVETNCPVSRLETDGDRWFARTSVGDEEADAVVAALPPPAAAALLRDAGPDLAAALRRIPMAGVATVQLGYREADAPLPAAMGFVVPAVEGRFVIACSFPSRKFPGRAPEGHVLLRAFVGGAHAALGDDEIATRVQDDLRDLLGIVARPVLSRVHRCPGAMPQYLLGHVEHVARIERLASRHPGLALAGNGYRGVGVPDCVAGGRRAAERLMQTEAVHA